MTVREEIITVLQEIQADVDAINAGIRDEKNGLIVRLDRLIASMDATGLELRRCIRNPLVSNPERTYDMRLVDGAIGMVMSKPMSRC
jgi:hypothetical protein